MTQIQVVTLWLGWTWGKLCSWTLLGSGYPHFLVQSPWEDLAGCAMLFCRSFSGNKSSM